MIKWLAVPAVALALSLASTAAQAAPCAGFTDVDDTSPFCVNVTWLKNRGVTLGCTSTTLFCPGDFVSRLQMAIFMNRLGDSLFPLTCAAGQVMKWDGLQWACANDAIGGGGGGGTVTSVAAGTGLQGSPNPITGAGSLNLAPGYQLPQACTNGQVPKSNGAGGWACGTDAAGTGTVTSVTAGTGLTGGTITASGTVAADTSYLQRRVSSTCAVGSSIRIIAADGTVTCQTDNSGPANAFVQGGNTFGTTARLGTNDNQAVELIANTSPVLRVDATGRTAINAPSSEIPDEVELSIFGQQTGFGGLYANLFMRQSFTNSGGYLISVGDALPDTNGAWFYLDQYKPSGTNSGQRRRLAIDFAGRIGLNRADALVAGVGSMPLVVGTDGTTGNSAYLSPGGSWTNGSSRTFKEDFAAVDGASVLAKVLAMPVTTWRYRDSNEGRHMGPIAEDFAAAFGLGDGDRYIGTVDGIGVALAAIQGLGARMDSEIAAKDARIADLEARLAHQVDAMTAQQREIAELRRAVDVVLTRTSPDGKLAVR